MKRKRHLNPCIKFTLEVLCGLCIGIMFISAMFMNNTTQLDRYTDASYVSAKAW
jgi:hypothetical protein|uniref:Uncharacterized protein n=1 Tax=Siphoviridae sp. ctulf7 TaxID=2826505 RepID=A0A8S5M5Z0_9CAUD|nr:MAG TPA: hypothetical protein [Siphoviridae sp. ctulf7]